MPSVVGTAIVVLIVAAACFFAIRSIVRDKKAGKSVQCGGDCRNCRGCH